MTRAASRLFGPGFLVLVLATVIGFVSAAPTNSGGDAVHVQAGQSIQAAINAAPPGTRIVVEAGIYAEQLTIKEDGISLVGRGAVLVPPAAPAENMCSNLAGNDTEAGICVQGADIELAPFEVEHRKVLSVGRAVDGVSVTGFEVHGFSGENIAVVGAQDAHVTGNWLYEGVTYGFLTAGSKNTRVGFNAVVSSETLGFIGICNDDMSGAQVFNNHVTGYIVGLCVQTSAADIQDNDISNCCDGAFVDPGIKGAKVLHNHIGKLNPSCLTDFGYLGGIILGGSVNTDVRFNLVEGQTLDGVAGGIEIVDFPLGESVAVASGNVVTFNTLRNNDVDLYVNTTGTGNVLSNNQCSAPAELCS